MSLSWMDNDYYHFKLNVKVGVEGPGLYADSFDMWQVTRKVASKSPRGQNGNTGEDSAGKGQQSKPLSATQTEPGKTTNKPKAVSQR